MNTAEAIVNLLEGKKIRSESFGVITKHIEIIEGGAYKVDHMNQLQVWNITNDISKKDWSVVGEETIGANDSKEKSPEEIAAAEESLKDKSMPELIGMATPLGIEIPDKPVKADLIKAIALKM